MVISLSIYSLIAVEFFYQFGIQPRRYPDGTELAYNDSGADDAALETLCSYKNIEGTVAWSASSRELCYGKEYFGTFTRAWLTLFQVFA